MLLTEEAVHVWAQGVYGKSLYLPLSFAVNLNAGLKKKTKTRKVRASLIAQLVNNLPAMQETLVRFLGWEVLLEMG